MKNDGFARLFETQTRQIQKAPLQIEGRFPSWLYGTLIRNGPALFETKSQKFNHWFDGLAMLHAFAFQKGKVTYSNSFLDTRPYQAAQKGKIQFREFATDPCRRLFRRISSVFLKNDVPNANVNICQVAKMAVALTEQPIPVEFDLQTLKTLGVIRFDDALHGQLTTAHPHHDARKKLGFNYLTLFGPRSKYALYTLADGSNIRELLCEIQAPLPAYMHSFALTQNYVILTEFPLRVNPLDLLVSGKPFIENFRWQPQATRFIVVSRRNKKVKCVIETEAFFAFHHVNAFEQGDKINLDIAAYPDPSIIQALYLDPLRHAKPNQRPPLAQLRRYTLDLKSQDSTMQKLSDETVELPRINYSYNGKPYRFVYACGTSEKSPHFFNQLVKIDVRNKSANTWRQEDAYPGEPVFIDHPNAKTEDDGIILSVVFQSKKQRSFLLALDARTFQEIGRANTPHVIPLGFHGHYFESNGIYPEAEK